MFRMVVGHSDEVEAADVVASVVEQCEAGLNGASPRAGLLFSTFDADPAALASGFAEAYPDVDLIGSTSMGEMSSEFGYLEDSVVLALFVSDTVDITAGLGTGLNVDRRAAVHRAVEEARGKTDREPTLCITTPSVAGWPPNLLADLREELGDGVTVVGGGAVAGALGDGADQGHQFFNGRVLSDAVPVLLFSGPLVHSFGVDAGWHPVGKRGRVTRVAEGTVYEIDDEPALGFYERYLGAGARPTSANPLAVFEEDSDDFYLRVAFADDEHPGALRVVGGLGEGARVQLAVAATEGIFDGTRSAFQRALKAYPEGSVPGAALLFACAVRKALLGTRTGRELEIARTEFGEGLT
ncbi:MAG: FIST N-terminal domain-containing protein, partial [Actinomycetota bacterium]